MLIYFNKMLSRKYKSPDNIIKAMYFIDGCFYLLVILGILLLFLPIPIYPYYVLHAYIVQYTLVLVYTALFLSAYAFLLTHKLFARKMFLDQLKKNDLEYNNKQVQQSKNNESEFSTNHDNSLIMYIKKYAGLLWQEFLILPVVVIYLDCLICQEFSSIFPAAMIHYFVYLTDSIPIPRNFRHNLILIIIIVLLIKCIYLFYCGFKYRCKLDD